MGVERGFCTIGGSTKTKRTTDSQCRLSGYLIPKLKTPTSEPGAARLGDTVFAIGGHTADPEGVFGVSTAESLRLPHDQ